MSKPKNYFEIPTQYEGLIMNRLICIGLYEYVSWFTLVDESNYANIKKVLELLIPNYNVDHIVTWLIDGQNYPTKYERAVLLNLTDAPSEYIISRLKVSNTNINRFQGSRQFHLDKTPDVGTLIYIQSGLLKTTFTKLNFVKLLQGYMVR